MNLFLIIAGLCIAAALVWLVAQPGKYRVSRKRTIHTPPEKVYALLSDFRNWPQWSPWLIHEPTAILDFSDTSNAQGSWYRWDGEQIGAGRITQIGAEHNQSIALKLEFFKPFHSQSEARFQLVPEEDSTHVEWIMEGKMPFLFRWMAAMMDRMVGGDFELGLVQLAREAGDPDSQLELSFEGEVETEACHYVCQGYEGPADDLPRVLDLIFTQMKSETAQLGITLVGAPFVLYHRMDSKSGQVQCDICLPTEEGYSIPGYAHAILPGRRYQRTQMRGDYHFFPLAWHAAFGHLRMSRPKLDKGSPMVERYISDPESTVGNERVSVIDLPIR